MKTREQALAEAAQNFVDKVDSGRATSRDSYAKFKAALALPVGLEEKLNAVLEEGFFPGSETPLDDYGREVVRECIALLTTQEPDNG
jgi:hypothetical protein